MKFLILALCIAAASCDLIPLADDQAILIRSSWDEVKHNEVDILYAIFKANPDIQARFPQFAGKDLDSIKTTGQFAVHAGRIVGVFSEISALQPDESGISAAKTLINALGASHRGRGISKAQFNEFRASLITYLSQNVSWGDNVAQAWEKGFNNVYFILFNALDGTPI
uniref:Globin XI n=1 Tax=Chironomus thummi thummi TaxID=7155 RepID=O02370_CHITH|nr:globin XI [Chironomus thummi thummi]